MRKELISLREKMKAHGFDAYMIPTTDFHQSEYVHDHFKCREFVSGFTGSAGTLIVTMDEAGLWTDGRYFLQAEAQLEGSGIELMKMNQPGVPTIIEYLETVLGDLSKGKILGFDGRLCTVNDIPEGKFNIVTDCDLIDEIWLDRPIINPSEIYPLDISVTGETHESKLSRLRTYMNEKSADYHIMTCLDEIAWLFNLRGNDVNHTPVFFAYALITSEECRLYVMNEKLIEKTDSPNGELSTVCILPYDQFIKNIDKLHAGTLLIDKNTISYAILDGIPENIAIISEENPVAAMKSIKNQAEINSTKKAHLKDGAAMVEFLCWLKSNINKTSDNNGDVIAPITEISASDTLEAFRKKQEGFRDLSFETISGYGSNGAIVHYSATEETNKTLQAEGFYLVDSGGQYEDGTTDITRTVALGPLTDEMKLHYTTVLKSHIKLCTAEFKPGTTGAQLDALTREPLQEIGLDYNHGTGHGVGHLLGCHEGPQTISPRDKTHHILPGMINSDEPGVYIEGCYGIRLENEILCVDKGDVYGFEPITFCPFDRDAILPALLTGEELQWLNDYHRQVFDKISPLVDKKTKEWLKEATREF